MASWEWGQSAPKLPSSAGCSAFASLNEPYTADKGQAFSGWKKGAEGFSKSHEKS